MRKFTILLYLNEKTNTLVLIKYNAFGVFNSYFDTKYHSE